MVYTYIVQCADGTLYTGWAVNLEKRLAAHNGGTGAKYTRCRLPVKLVYFEEQDNQSRAQKREAGIKKLRRCQKIALISEFNKQKI
ncbi:GIY-YIG nuclease family protein [Pelosinus sp. sgz500959]|uniref:GIY-YIG nuclease family protein n=1 Tax=Pelosinus sp. sgz500959 TaxID=3242472 RepID=UPI00366AF407